MTMPLFLDGSGAHFSACQKYRYHLWRRVGAGDRKLAVIGLNPSTADAVKNDPTIARLCVRAQRLGFGELHMLNLFGWRSTDPHVLTQVDDPMGPDNDSWILDVAGEADMVLCAWGTHAGARSTAVAAMLRDRGIKLHALRLNDDGSPAHPLYLPYELQPQLWEPS